MNQLSHWIVALIVFALIGGIGTWYFRAVVQRRDRLAAGIRALSALSWRDFIHLVLKDLERRGYARVLDHRSPSGDNDYVLTREGKRYLLSCKHGSAYVLGKPAVAEFANAIRFANTHGGILATQGHVADEARPMAGLQNIELLDGAALWPELRDLLKPGQLDDIVADAYQKARQRSLMSWLLALLTGVGVFLLMPASEHSTAASADPRAAEDPTASLTAPAPPDAPLPTIPAPTDEAALQKQREDVAAAITKLPQVERAIWSTPSTLQVFLRNENGDPIAQLCPLLVRYDALAPSRLQLTPPPGSTAQTRFRQCRSY